MTELILREIRCTNCRRLLAREYIFSGRLEIVCKCGELTRITFKHSRNAIVKEARAETTVGTLEKGETI